MRVTREKFGLRQKFVGRTEELPVMRHGRFQSWMMRNSPGASKKGMMSPTITTSRSRKSAVPFRP